MRTWIKQPYGKNQCGQVAVAVVAGIPLDKSIEIIGTKGCTNTKDIAKALHSLGYKCPNKCRKMPRPPLAIAKLRNSKRKCGWHWVVVDGDKIFDGVGGTPDGKVKWMKKSRITSYLPIEE